MKNEQRNDQNLNDPTRNKQKDVHNPLSDPKNPPPENQRDQSQQNNSQWQNKQSQGSAGNEKSNIAVGNDGKIGKAQDKWTDDDTSNNNSKRNEENSQNSNQQKDTQVRNDKTVTEPEIDAPIYDPEKTEKKIPQMGSNEKK